MITINPARELGLDGRLGSIEVGKDADIVLFNGHPFDAFSRCELALIDGEVYLPAARAGREDSASGRASTRRCRPRPSRCGTARSRSPRSPRTSSPWSAPTSTRSPGRKSRGGPWSSPTARSRRSGRPGHADPARSPDHRDERPGHLAGNGRRRIDDRPVRDRQPDRDPGLRRRRPVSARAAQQHRASPR